MTTFVLGMDISRWEDDPGTPVTVDFRKAKAAGVEFCWARATYGVVVDPTYLHFRNNCRGVMPFGAYAYVYPPVTASIASQAAKFISVVKDDVPELPLVFDWEHEGVDWNMAYQWLDAVSRANLGREILIYSRKEFLDRKLPSIGSAQRAWFQRFGLWLAYYADTEPTQPVGWGEWELWQYTDRGDGAVYGMPQPEAKAVDLNRYNGSLEQFLYRYKLGGVVVEPPPPPPPPPPPVAGLGWVRPRYVPKGPAIVVGNPAPRTGNFVVPLLEKWQAWLRRLNDNDPRRWQLMAQTQPLIGPTKGLVDGRLRWIMHTWSGNVVRILEERGDFFRIQSVDASDGVPPATINYKRTPWLVHTMTTVNKSGAFMEFAQAWWNTLRCPVISKGSEFWVSREWIMRLDDCTVNVIAVNPLTVYSEASMDSSVVEVIAKGRSVLIRKVVGNWDGNLWGQTVGGWVCVRLQGQRQTSWWI